MKIQQLHSLLTFIVLAGLMTCLTGRAENISLNGKWQLAFDEKQEGESKQWFLDQSYPATNAVEIDVPASWETVRKDFEGVGWYRKTFDAPKQLEGKAVRVHFGAVNYVAKVYLNGQPVGVHEGGYDPFEFTIDDQLKFDGPNVLVVRVVSPIITQKSLMVDGMRHWDVPHRRVPRWQVSGRM